MKTERLLGVGMPDILVDDSFEDLTANSEKPKRRLKKERKAEAAQDESAAVAAAAGDDAEDAGGGKKRRREKPDKAESADKQEKPGKAAKAGRQAAKAAGEKSGNHLLLKIIIIAAVVVLVGGFVFEEILFNKLGVRDWTRDAFINASIWLDPDTATVQRTQRRRSEELDMREADLEARDERRRSELDDRRKELDERKAGLDEREDSLTKMETALEQRSDSLDKREQEMTSLEISKIPIFRRALSDQELADIEALSGTFAAMTPESAADILVRMYDPGNVAVIIYYMSQKNAAAILSVMDPAYAANLTQMLLDD